MRDEKVYYISMGNSKSRVSMAISTVSGAFWRHLF